MITSGLVRTGLCLVACAATSPTVRAQDPVARATAALEQGRPWQATELLRPVVADATRAPHGVLLLAARAAGEWGGWRTVATLLDGRQWSDSSAAGAAAELLGRAALDRRADDEAEGQFRIAIATAATPRQQGVRVTLLARALERQEQWDSAAHRYTAAAALLPEASEWLQLRAAALTADSSARLRLLAAVGAEPARSRAAWVEAVARERFGDSAGAAFRYNRLGARLDALRLQLAPAAPDSIRRDTRRSLLALLATPMGADDSRAAIALLDRQPALLSTEEQLIVARRAATAGLHDRAVRGFAAAGTASGLRDADRLRHGISLAQAGRSVEALAQFDAIRDPASRGAAAYQGARLVLARWGATRAIPALLRVPEVAGPDSTSAGIALFLAGDLVADQGDLREARDHYARVAAEYPTSGHAPRALLEVGTLSYLLGERDRALEAFRDLAERYPEREEGSAGLYWAGRIDAMRGDRASALARWRTLIAAVPHSYYALAAARRLGEPAWTPDSTVALEPPPPEMLAALARVALLDSLGFTPEREFELDHLTRLAGGDIDPLIRTAHALAAAGHTSRSVGLAQRALAAGAPRTRNLYLLLFPVPEPAVFSGLVAERGLDPWLTAGLIKQESGFNPRARSAADARGLMQLLPSVGAQLARGMGWKEWESALLYQPEVSLTLGTVHLRDMRRQYPEPVRFLAAYNAGGTRVRRWDSRPGVLEDPELYLEMIPYIETRNYVRRVLRNAAFYEGLYGR